MAEDKIIKGAFDYAKISKMTRVMPMIAVYEHPDDYPDEYVARLWDANEATRLVAVADTLGGIRAAKPPEMVEIPPAAGDKVIVEYWI